MATSMNKSTGPGFMSGINAAGSIYRPNSRGTSPFRANTVKD